jgi:MFS family permease
VLVLLLRFSISQMDVPTRQSYTMAVVRPEERSAVAGLTGVARTTGAALAPLFTGLLFGRSSLISLPFLIAGTLKILYDLLLYQQLLTRLRLRLTRCICVGLSIAHNSRDGSGRQ